jgi:hypothetical protein
MNCAFVIKSVSYFLSLYKYLNQAEAKTKEPQNEAKTKINW